MLVLMFSLSLLTATCHPAMQAMDTTDPEKVGPQAAEVDGVTMLRLLKDCSGVFRPGILTALLGSSGAGKTTLMDVLAGRKTSTPLGHHSAVLRLQDSWTLKCTEHYRLGTQNFGDSCGQ